MKKRFFGFFTLVVLVIVGCSSTPSSSSNTSKIQVLPPYDPASTSENASTFIFPKEIMVQKMDGVAVSLYDGAVPGWVASSGKPVSILIPPGEHSFTCVFTSQIGGKVLSASNLAVSANFEIGKTYNLTYRISNADNTVSLEINEQAVVE